MIGVIDYRAGNAQSVLYALERLGLAARLVATPTDLAHVERLVLPGVGAARATLDSLADGRLVEPLTRAVLREQVPFLGICIGLQVLFEQSEEGDTACLGWLPGAVRRFSSSVRVPQIGWNEVRFRRDHPLRAGLDDSVHCYFVNSYRAVPGDSTHVLGVTDYDEPFCSVVATANVAATQFHAEKSGEVGLRMLRNFATWVGGPC